MIGTVPYSLHFWWNGGRGRRRGKRGNERKHSQTRLKTANWESRPPRPGSLPHPAGCPSAHLPHRTGTHAGAVFVCLVINTATRQNPGQRRRFAPSASLPYDYGRLINKHKPIQDKREPRYKHQICQSGTIFRQQMMLSFEGDLPETLL